MKNVDSVETSDSGPARWKADERRDWAVERGVGRACMLLGWPHAQNAFALTRLLSALDIHNSAFAPYRLMARGWVLGSGLARCYEKQKTSSGTKSVSSFGQTAMAALSLDPCSDSTRRSDK
jgi:hypothetical protein